MLLILCINCTTSQEKQIKKELLRQEKKITTIYHGNVKTKVLHKPGCRYYNCKNCTASFKSKQDAINAGYRPCKNCKP